MANHDIWPIIENDDDHDYLTVAEIRVEEAYKGHPARTVLLISERNSGGFYVDEGRSYLLFLSTPAEAGWTRGYQPGRFAFTRHYARPRFINYSCGQSVPWAEVSAKKGRVLDFETRRQAGGIERATRALKPSDPVHR